MGGGWAEAGGDSDCDGSVGACEKVASGVGSSCVGPSAAGAAVGKTSLSVVLSGALAAGGSSVGGSGCVATAGRLGAEADANAGTKPTDSIMVVPNN